MKEKLSTYPEAEQNSELQVIRQQLNALIDESHSRTIKLIKIQYKLTSGQINELEAQAELDEIPGAY